MSNSLRSEFDSVDRTNDPGDFVRYLDLTRRTDFIQEIKQRTFALMELRDGQTVADLGCGTVKIRRNWLRLSRQLAGR